MIKLSEEYRPRPVRSLGLWEIGEWRLKVYGIAYRLPGPEPRLIEAARQVTAERLKASAGTTNHYGVGFVGIHQGKTGNFVFVDWWADENELHHHVHTSACEKPIELRYATPTGLAACTWDLFLIGHERDAWVRHALKRTPAPDLDAYLNATLNEDV